MAKYIVGLTGGIGSGKSAVSERFEKLGITVIDADIVAREVVETGKPALKKIREHFGSKILLNDGNLDRAQLRTIIFSNPEEKLWLESLLHPLIGEEINAQLDSASSPYAILVSPLLIEMGNHERCDRVLVVDVPEEVQLARTMARDDNGAEQVKRIIASQISRTERLKHAEDIIDNTMGFDYLDKRVRELHALYLEESQQKQ